MEEQSLNDEFKQKRLLKHIIYGPINSRRFGRSLGINIMPEVEKLCTFDCVYCECGFSNPKPRPEDIALHDSQSIISVLEYRLKELKENDIAVDSITFSGNGEPTLHPKFSKIIDETIRLRDEYYPDTNITVLSNSTTITKPDVVAALKRIDMPVLKLDSAITSTMRAIDLPHSPKFNSNDLIKQLGSFGGNVIIQTILIKGKYKGVEFDNTTEKEIEAYLNAMEKIKPKMVMLYALDRKAPVASLEKVPAETLRSVASRIRKLNIEVTTAE
jgi:wyosine [tRNA(Phe)-imidazoG37] synthetase (radical SAM superfamily)